MHAKNHLSRDVLGMIESGINHALDHTPEIKNDLINLDKQIIQVNIKPFTVALFITFNSGKIILSFDESEKPITIVTGAALTFLKLLLSRESTIPQQIHIEGDIHYIITLNQIIHALELDWEELLSKVTGDAPAFFIGSRLRQLKGWLHETIDTFKIDTKEYLVDEKALLPASFELNEFFEAVDEIKHRTARLEKKIEILQNVL